VTPLANWLRHKEVYDKMRKLRFFGLFGLSKAFKNWRWNVRQYLFNYARSYVGVCLMGISVI
jgi:hypothetical protein